MNDVVNFRDWKRYTSDRRWDRIYSDYQQRYKVEPRESDKKSARLVLSSLRQMNFDRAPRILDIGCSTGNFLRHLKHVLPDADLTGGDLMQGHLDECRNDDSLSGLAFETMDILKLPAEKPFDVIVANAVSVYFDKDEYGLAAKSIFNALSPGGFFVGFELVFPGSKERTVIEPSDAHPEGLKVELRSEDFVRHAFTEAGFAEFEHMLFEIPIDLPKPEGDGSDADLISWTEFDAITGRRILWRGINPKTRWYQPWSHIVARKA